MFQAYCIKKVVDPGSYRFFLEGVRLSPESTPGDLTVQCLSAASILPCCARGLTRAYIPEPCLVIIAAEHDVEEGDVIEAFIEQQGGSLLP